MSFPRVCHLPFLEEALLNLVLASVAIWNKNKLIAALATGIWATNASIHIHGKPLSLLVDPLNAFCPRSHTGNNQPQISGHSGLISLQIRSSWDPELVSCSLPNVKSNTSVIISMLASDIVLLLIMFVGLFRLRHRGGGTFSLVRLLWKQVRCWFCQLRCSPPTYFISARKGVIYLLVATAAELPPAVRVTSSLYIFISHPYFTF